MTQTFKCKRPGCPEKVTYSEDRVRAFRRVTPGTIEKKRQNKVTKVYLTCPRGHRYPYEVTK